VCSVRGVGGGGTWSVGRDREGSGEWIEGNGERGEGGFGGAEGG